MYTYAPVKTLFARLTELEVESPDDKLALLLAQVVVNRLCDSLAVVALKKHGYYASYMMADALVEIMQDRQKKRSRHLITHSQTWRLKHWQTHTVKNKKK